VSPSAGCCWLACAFRDRTCSSRSPTTPDACFARSDFHRSKQRTLVEFDGKTKYGRSMQPGKDPGDVVFHEKVREDRLREMGFEVVRWIWDDLQRPNVLEQRFAPRARPWFSPLRASVPAHPRYSGTPCTVCHHAPCAPVPEVCGNSGDGSSGGAT